MRRGIIDTKRLPSRLRYHNKDYSLMVSLEEGAKKNLEAAAVWDEVLDKVERH